MSASFDYGYGSQSQYSTQDPYGASGGYGADDGTGAAGYDAGLDPNQAGDAAMGFDDTITQEDCWAVIAAYFEDKTLVSQQIDSFNEFVNNTMQELVDESSSLILDQNMQHSGRAGDQTKRYELNFNQIYLSRPTQTEADGTVAPMFPNEARLRNLTYSAPLYIDIKKRVLVQESDEPDPETGEMAWTEERDDDDTGEEEKIYIGKVRCLCVRKLSAGQKLTPNAPLCDRYDEQVPIMLQSSFCILNGLEDKDKLELNECPFDKVRFQLALRRLVVLVTDGERRGYRAVTLSSTGRKRS